MRGKVGNVREQIGHVKGEDWLSGELVMGEGGGMANKKQQTI